MDKVIYWSLKQWDENTPEKDYTIDDIAMRLGMEVEAELDLDNPEKSLSNLKSKIKLNI